MLKTPKNRKIVKWLLLAGAVLLLIGAAVYVYFATLIYGDTAKVKADFTVEAIPFIKEFEKDYKQANKKYAERIVTVRGVVTATVSADTTMNIEMKDVSTGSYIIFAFQQQHLDKAKTIKAGDKVSIKGSCSDGVFSEILGVYFISFKRCTLNK